MHSESILILDFGSQYTQLIARKVRELGVYSEIKPYNVAFEKIGEMAPKGIIFSGGPESVYDENAPWPDSRVFELDVPILGVCYGLQLLAHRAGAQVAESSHREFGLAYLHLTDHNPLFKGVSEKTQVWMSHGDSVKELPNGYSVFASTENAPFAAFANVEKKRYGIQFHPEVAHSLEGKTVLNNFVKDICGCSDSWTPQNFVKESVAHIRETVGDKHAICALSGGVDSAVAAALMHEAIGERLHCVFVDTGLLRKGEAAQVSERFAKFFGGSFTVVDASERFFKQLRGVTDPEVKRKRIGAEFINVFEQKARKLEHVDFLVQGTLYPDVIESVSPQGGPSVTIKSHHNVGGLPEKLALKLVEPLRELFKDEVREVGRAIGLPEDVLMRHPFPGPGLAVRILGEITPDRVARLQEADDIFIRALHDSGCYNDVWQAFAVLLPIQTVGVMGDNRTYENAIALRTVTSVDGMTADWGRLPNELLAEVSNRIINKVRGINRVVYDISSKPPATIEWE